MDRLLARFSPDWIRLEGCEQFPDKPVLEEELYCHFVQKKKSRYIPINKPVLW